MKPLFFIIMLIFCFNSEAMAQEDILLKPVVVPVPGSGEYKVHRNIKYRDTASGRTLADIFVPDAEGAVHPAVIFIHGGPIPDKSVSAKDWGIYQSYGPLVTGAGLAGIVFNHRFNGLNDFKTPADDIRALVDFIRANAEKYSIDKDRICLWFFSGGGSFIGRFLSEQPEWLKCIVIYYGVVDHTAWKEMTGAELTQSQQADLNPVPVLESKPDRDPAFFIAEAGKDSPMINAGLKRFTEAAVKNGWKVEFWNHPEGPHTFDVLKDDKRSHEIILRTIDFLKTQLNNGGSR